MGSVGPGAQAVYLGLGSNLGDRSANLQRALGLLDAQLKLRAVSSLYETEPWGYQDQPRFLNCACAVTTLLPPRELLAAVKHVERSMGREPSFPDGPRLIDVDILLYGQSVLSEPDLEIPHPRLAERAFVLVPLSEIDPSLVHPVLKRTVGDLLEELGPGEDGLPKGVERWTGVEKGFWSGSTSQP